MMKNPLNLLRRKPQTRVTSFLPKEHEEHLRKTVKALDKPVTKPRLSRGRVIKQTRSSEFDSELKNTRGRIVRVMPRKLQKIKQSQEKVEDESQASVKDLEE